MVEITYTGIDGKKISFDSSSPDNAIERLSRVKGYATGEADKIGGNFSESYKSRHKKRIEEAISRSRNLMGSIGGSKFSSGNGVVSGIDTSDIDVVDGNLVKTSRKQFVDGEGNIVGYGSKKTEDIGELKSEVIDVVTHVDLSFSKNGLIRLDVKTATAEIKKKVREGGYAVEIQNSL